MRACDQIIRRLNAVNQQRKMQNSVNSPNHMMGKFHQAVLMACY